MKFEVSKKNEEISKISKNTSETRNKELSKEKLKFQQSKDKIINIEQRDKMVKNKLREVDKNKTFNQNAQIKKTIANSQLNASSNKIFIDQKNNDFRDSIYFKKSIDNTLNKKKLELDDNNNKNDNIPNSSFIFPSEKKISSKMEFDVNESNKENIFINNTFDNSINNSSKLNKNSALEEYDQENIEEENFNVAELEYISPNEKISTDDNDIASTINFYLNEDQLNQDSGNQLNFSKESYYNLIENDKEYLSDDENKKQNYEKVSDILRLYESDPLYKKGIDKFKFLKICEMHYDVYFWTKILTIIQNLSTSFIIFQLYIKGFTLPPILLILFISFRIIHYCKALFENSVTQITAEPDTFVIKIYKMNCFGKEYFRKYSLYQVAGNRENNNLFAFEFIKDDLISESFELIRFSKTINENYFKNSLLHSIKINDNEFVMKYLMMMYSFSKREIIDNKFDKNSYQEFLFKNITKDYLQTFPNFNKYIKEKFSRQRKNEIYVDYIERRNIILVYFFFTYFILIFHFVVFKIMICVYFKDIEGGIEKLKTE